MDTHTPVVDRFQAVDALPDLALADELQAIASGRRRSFGTRDRVAALITEAASRLILENLAVAR